MERAAAVLIACLLDLLVGDPARYPHPVRLIGAAADRLRRLAPNRRAGGVVVTGVVVGGTYAVVWLVLFGLRRLGPAWAFAAEAVLIYTAVAMHDLAGEARAVEGRLLAGDLPGARRRVARIVGRETRRLDKAGVARAAVESVAESTVDGVLAPLFWAFIGGAPLALAFKAASTLDSMYGYKDDARRDFGWAPARLDDLANAIPARLALLVMPAAAALSGRHGMRAARIGWRDRAQHASPNSAISEAAVAGALGVALGGPNVYGGVRVDKPYLGDALRAIRPEDIRAAVRIMFLSAALFIALGAIVRAAVITCFL